MDIRTWTLAFLTLLTACFMPSKGLADNMGRQAGNWGIVGSSGSGKSTFVRSLLLEYKARVPNGIIFAPSEEMREIANYSAFVSPAMQTKNLDPNKLEQLYRAHGWVHYEVPPNRNTMNFIHHALEPVWKLGKFDTEQCHCVIVYIEAKNFLRKGSLPEGHNAERLESEGRKYGIDLIKDFQRWQSSGKDALDLAALSQITRRVVLPTQEQNARKRILQECEGVRDPATMQRPSGGFGGELDILDSLRGKKAEIRREPDGTRILWRME
jgi:hypothetical protein